MADGNVQSEIDTLKKQKEKLDAQKALLDAEKALADAKQPPDAELKALKDAKALSDAKKDSATSQFEEWKARYLGSMSSAGFSGAVELKDKAGQIEGSLLGVQAIREAASKIFDEIDGKGPFEVFASKEFPNFQRLQLFRFQKQITKEAFASAGIKPSKTALEVPAPAVISAGLDAFSKLVSFFKTDYTIGGVQLTLDESLLLSAVSGRLARTLKSENMTTLPMIYLPSAKASAIDALAKDLAELADLRGKAQAEQKLATDGASAQEDAASKEKDDTRKQDLLKQTAVLKAQAEKIKGAITTYENFVSSLTTADSKGVVPLAALGQEYAIEEAFEKGSNILLLRLENVGGSYYIKKNLLSGLFGIPLYHMGGATVSYFLLDGRTGRALAANIFPVHGGFVKAGNLAKHLQSVPISSTQNRPPAPRSDP